MKIYDTALSEYISVVRLKSEKITRLKLSDSVKEISEFLTSEKI